MTDTDDFVAHYYDLRARQARTAGERDEARATCNDLRAKLARFEEVVSAARRLRDYAHPADANAWGITSDLRESMTTNHPHLAWLIAHVLVPALDDSSVGVAATEDDGERFPYREPCGCDARSVMTGCPTHDLPREPALPLNDSSVGVAATAEDGHEVPAPNRQRVEPPSDPATGTTRREPPESATCRASTGAVTLTRADALALIAEERERVCAAVEAAARHCRSDGRDSPELDRLLYALRTTGKP